MLLLFLLWIAGSQCFGLVDTANLNRLWNRYRESATDSLKILHLSDIAFYYYDGLGDPEIADSLSSLAIRIAEKSYRPDLLLLAYNLYLESNDLSVFQKKAKELAGKAGRLCIAVNNPGMEWRTCKNTAAVHLAGYAYDQALTSGYRELSIAGILENDTLRAESYLDIGRSLQGKNQMIEAFRNYLNATFIAEKMNDPELLIKCYSRLSRFYNDNKVFDKAIEYKLLQTELIKSTGPVDSVALMWSLFDLQNIDFYSNYNRINEVISQEILEFAYRHKLDRLKDYIFTLYRTHLIEADQIGQLYQLYHERYPGELSETFQENPSLYYRLMALFNEYKDRPDSAYYYFNKAEQLVRNDPNKILQSRFYDRFGQFLVRQGKYKDAIGKFTRSFDLAKEASFLDYMLSASRNLEVLSARTGNFKMAYSFAVQNRVLADSIGNLAKKDQLIILEIAHETRQRELAAEREQQKILRRHNIQYTAIPVIIVAVFIILLMFGSFRVPEWSIRVMGFFSFIFLFEFIVLIADHKILEITHGEPWKILLIKIFLIALLLPFHEWLEKKVIEYLLAHKLIDFSKFYPGRILRRPAGKTEKK
jgi:hypothetical protein